MTSQMELGREDLEQRLRDLDRAVTLTFPGRSFRLVLVGGGAMVLLGCLARSTSDLDVLDVPPALVGLLEQYDLSCRVTAYLDHFAYNLEDRLVPLSLGTKSVDCYSASLEDVVASKLYSDRVTDELDVRRPEVLAALDWDWLERVVADMRDSRLNDRRYRQFLGNYRAYREEYGPCDT